MYFVESTITHPQNFRCAIVTKCRCGKFTRNGFKSYEVMILNVINSGFLTARDIQLRNFRFSIAFRLNVQKIVTTVQHGYKDLLRTGEKDPYIRGPLLSLSEQNQYYGPFQ